MMSSLALIPRPSLATSFTLFTLGFKEINEQSHRYLKTAEPTNKQTNSETKIEGADNFDVKFTNVDFFHFH